MTELLHRRVIHDQSETTYRTKYDITMRLDRADLIQRSIFYDAWECDELNLLRETLRPNDIMLDIGANVGLFSLVAAKAVGPTGAVHAFEPIPNNCNRLRENLELNGFTNVFLNQSAAGDTNGGITLSIDADMERTSGPTTSGYFTASLIENPVRQVTAHVDTIDSYLARRIGVRPVRLVKIDVEGSEPAVLRGMQSTLMSHSADIVLIEVNIYTLRRNGSTIRDVVGPLNEADYYLYRLGFGGLLWRWSYHGEPSVPDRRPGPSRLFRGVYRGVQDTRRLFNLVAIRGDIPGLRDHPTIVRTVSLDGGGKQSQAPQMATPP